MIVLGYIGNDKKDPFTTRLARKIIQWAQKGSFYEKVTHVESLLAGNAKSARIGSSSLKDGGVRIKDNVELNPKNWMAMSVPLFSEAKAEAWHVKNNGKKYDFKGALATILWLMGHEQDEIICVEAVAIPQNIIDAWAMTTAEFMAFCASLPGSVDVTTEFFKDSK